MDAPRRASYSPFAAQFSIKNSGLSEATVLAHPLGKRHERTQRHQVSAYVKRLKDSHRYVRDVY
jgi:hypothetical protein